MSENNEWYRLLDLSRAVAAEDLKISNEILEVVDTIVSFVEDSRVESLGMSKVSNDLVELSARLTEHSRQLSVAINKLVGAI